MPGRVVHRRLEVAVGVRHHDDLLVGRARQRGDRVLGLEFAIGGTIQLEVHRDLLAVVEPIAQREAFVLAERELRHLAQTAFGLELARCPARAMMLTTTAAPSCTARALELNRPARSLAE